MSTETQIQRYKQTAGRALNLRDDGEYIKFSDHAAIVARLERERDEAFNAGLEAAAQEVELRGYRAAISVPPYLRAASTYASDIRALKRPTAAQEKGESDGKEI